jgi:pimeloyl-ACP methyl ester carboxylesterase
MALNSPQEASVDLDGQTLAYQFWGEASQPPIIALHGWLDNAASFNFISPRMSDFRIYALDLAGHGLSYHRSRDSAYNIWQDIKDILDFADRLGLDEFILMGHSRGAIISSLLAGSHPARVSRLVLLDGFLPQAVTEMDAPSLLAQALADHKRLGRASVRDYSTLADAVAVRQEGGLGVTAEAARALGRRGISQSEAGFYWHADPRLRGASEFKLTESHCRVFAKALACRTLLLTAEQSEALFDQNLLSLNALVERQTIKGGHHFHMETAGAAAAADLINAFLREQ